MVHTREIEIIKTPIAQQANVFTKPLEITKFEKLLILT